MKTQQPLPRHRLVKLQSPAYPTTRQNSIRAFERMGRDGVFHPFKGRVSKHFGESVRFSISISNAHSLHVLAFSWAQQTCFCCERYREG